MVYLHLPNYFEEETHPLDIVGLILFGSASRSCLMCLKCSASTP